MPVYARLWSLFSFKPDDEEALDIKQASLQMRRDWQSLEAKNMTIQLKQLIRDLEKDDEEDEEGAINEKTAEVLAGKI
ncbi:MAG: hypothetical protein Q9191_001301 [Dirinaria sp. TL-2023a]